MTKPKQPARRAAAGPRQAQRSQPKRSGVSEDTLKRIRGVAGGGGGGFWKPKEGTNRVRFVPLRVDDYSYFFEAVATHFGLGFDGRGRTNCPRGPFWDEEEAAIARCPICEWLGRIRKKADYDDFRDWTPRKQFYYNIVNRADPELSVQKYVSGVTIFDILAAYFAPEDEDEPPMVLSDPERGHDFVVVKKTGASRDQVKYDKSRAVNKPSPLGLDDWEGQLIALDRHLNVPSFEGILERYGEWMIEVAATDFDIQYNPYGSGDEAYPEDDYEAEPGEGNDVSVPDPDDDIPF